MPAPAPQKPPQSKGLIIFLRELRGMFGGVFEWVEDLQRKFENLTETSFQLACKMAGEGRINDAQLRLRVALWLTPDHVPSLYNLGCIYHHKKLDDLAMQCFTKVLRKVPNHENALFMVCGMNPTLLKEQARPKTMPYAMAVEYFEGVARGYEYDQQLKGYQLPVMTHQLLNPLIEESGLVRRDLLDLGCATGLATISFQEQFANVVGVDFSEGMLDQAYRKMDRRGVKLFNRLINQDMRVMLQEAKDASFDVALCLQAFKYVGDAELVFTELARVLRPGGLFACSVDPYVQPQGFGLMAKSGYFGHSVNYVLALAEQAGLEVVRTGEVLGYTNQHVQLCIFRKAKVS